MQPVLTITQCEPLPDYRLSVVCSDGARGVFDMKPYLNRGVFQQLQSPEVFNRVRLLFGVPSWHGGIDIAAERVRSELVAA